MYAEILEALLAADNPPVNYSLTPANVRAIAECYDWEGIVDSSNWRLGTDYESVAEMVLAEPAIFLADISRYYGDDYYFALAEHET